MRSRKRSATRSSRRARSSASSRSAPRLSVEHAGIGLDPVAAAGDLHRRQAQGLSRVARRRQLRGDRRDRRQLRLRQHRGLLPEPVGARLRPVRQVRPRLPRPRRARAARHRRAAQEGDARLERGGHGEDPGLDVRRPTASSTSSSTCRSPTMPRRTTTASSTPAATTVGLSMFTGYSYNEKRRFQPRHHRPRNSGRHRAEGRLGRAERRTPARPRSSRTSRSRCA